MASRDSMIECERRTLYKRNGQKVWDWKRMNVADLDPEASSRDIRCVHCHGKVKLHRQQVGDGPQDHVEHASRKDSEGCPAGHYFQGTPRMSADPVT
jgi:hypothetical protein